MKHLKLGIGLALSMIALAIHGTYFANADTGDAGAVRKSIGSYWETRRVTASSFTPTELWPASRKRADSTCQITTGSAVWVSTLSTSHVGSLGAITHPAISDGFKVNGALSSLQIEGSNTGNLYFTCDTGVATCEMRCLDGMVR